MRTRSRAWWSLTNSPLGIDPPPLANQAATVARMSRSPHTRHSSRFSSCTRLHVSPSLRSLPSIPACFVQRRIAVADGSNSFVNRSGLRPARTNSAIRALSSGPYVRPTALCPGDTAPSKSTAPQCRVPTESGLPGRGLQGPRHSLAARGRHAWRPSGPNLPVDHVRCPDGQPPPRRPKPRPTWSRWGSGRLRDRKRPKTRHRAARRGTRGAFPGSVARLIRPQWARSGPR